MVVFLGQGVDEVERRRSKDLDDDDDDYDEADFSMKMNIVLKRLKPDMIAMIYLQFGIDYVCKEIVQSELHNANVTSSIVGLSESCNEDSIDKFLTNSVFPMLEGLLKKGVKYFEKNKPSDPFHFYKTRLGEIKDASFKKHKQYEDSKGIYMILQNDTEENPQLSSEVSHHEMIFPIHPIGDTNICIMDLIEEGKEDVLKEALCKLFSKHTHNKEYHDLISLYRESSGTVHTKVVIDSVLQLKNLFQNLIYNQSSIWKKMQEYKALKNELDGNNIIIDLTIVKEEYRSLSLKLDTLTAEQEHVIDACTNNNTVNIIGPAGSGKTFVALHQTLQFCKDSDRHSSILHIFKTKNLALFVARWLSHRNNSQHVLNRLYFYITEESKYIQIRVENNNLEVEDVNDEGLFENVHLIVVDEAQTVFTDTNQDATKDNQVGGILTNIQGNGKAHILILSNEAQSSSSSATEFPIDIDKTVELKTITRCSKAAALGSLCYVNCDTSSYKVEHEFDGEKIQTILFYADNMSDTEKLQEYAKQLKNTLGKIENNLPATDLDSDIVIFVPDTELIKKHLEKELDSTKYEIVTVADSLKCLNASEAKSDKTRLVLATCDETRGLEYLIGIALAMDGSLLYRKDIDGYTEPYPDPVVRCRIYVTSTRVHMALYFVNEIIPDGLLGDWLLAMRLLEKRLKALNEAEDQSSKARNQNTSNQKSHAVIDFEKQQKIKW